MKFLLIQLFVLYLLPVNGQALRDGMHFSSVNNFEIERFKVYLGRSLGNEKKTFTTIHFENNNPNKIFLVDIKKIKFKYPDSSSVERPIQKINQLIIPFGESQKRTLRVKKSNLWQERFSLETNGKITVGYLPKPIPFKIISLKNCKDTVISKDGIQIKINKIKVNGAKIYFSANFSIHPDSAKNNRVYYLNRQKIKLRNSEGKKIEIPYLTPQKVSIHKRKPKKHFYFVRRFDSENLSIDFSEVFSIVENSKIVNLPDFHLYAQAPFGHEMTCQDTIHLLDGSTILGTVVRVKQNLVAFRQCSEESFTESIDYTELNRDRIKKIIYSDGSTDDFENDSIDEKYVKTMIEIHKRK